MTAPGPNGAPPQDRNEVLRRALVELRSARARIDELERARSEPIAVIGVGCRFPGGVDGPEVYWASLLAGFDGVVEITADRWDADAYYDADPDAPGKMVARHAGLIEGVDQFDAALFGISPREAALMDPQQRLLLEVAWEALEHAGIAPDGVRSRRGGVFVGVTSTDYAHLGVAKGDPAAIDAYAASGNALNFVSGRLSYLLGLVGPSMAVDTACSSSLVAVHLACQSLRAGESDLALAAGVNLLLSPETSVALSKARMLSPEGRCKTFDAGADGYVRGEGCGVVVLKRLTDALADGDDVLAVVRGSAVNQDGRSSGLTVPNGPSQEEVITTALRAAGLSPREVGYVEAHGTGTPLGDPIELRAISRALDTAGRDEPLVVGSVKTNIGHLESAAGIAGLIKAVLALRHGEIPPHRHFETPNPHVDLEALGLSIPVATRPFPGPRVAGVSSFGVSGTNAHVLVAEPPSRVGEAPVVLAEAPPAEIATAPVVGQPVTVKVAGRDEQARAAFAARLAAHVAEHPAEPLAAIAWAANVGRADLSSRAAVRAASHGELVEGLRALAEGGHSPGLFVGAAPAASRPRTLFVVPGQGAHAAGALAPFYGRDPLITETIEELAAVLGPTDELPLRALLREGPDSAAALVDTAVAQPALYCLAVCLGRFWEAHGVTADVLLGHSVGAYAAAALAGVWSVSDGARLVAERGRAMGALAPAGAMAAVFASAEEIAPYLGEGVELAARNAARQCVISGTRSELDAALARLFAAKITTRDLEVGRAFHSRLVEPALPALAAAIADTTRRLPHTTLVSDTTGAPLKEEVTTVEYWTGHARRPTDFLAALSHLEPDPPDVAIELGPAATALSLVRQCLADVATIPTLRPGGERSDQLERALVEAWTAGHRRDWRDAERPKDVVHLPTYPFQHRSYWLPKTKASKKEGETTGTLSVEHVPTPAPHTITRTPVSALLRALLREHTVHGHGVVPGVVYLELLLSTAAHAAREAPLSVHDLELVFPLVLGPDDDGTIQTTLVERQDGGFDGEIRASVGGGAWQLHATARLSPVTSPLTTGSTSREEIAARCPHHVAADAFYRELWHPEFALGPSFRLVEQAWCGEDEVVGLVTVANEPNAYLRAGVRADLLTLDAAAQLLLVAGRFEGAAVSDRPLELGAGFAEFVTCAAQDSAQGSLWCWAKVRARDAHGVSGDLVLFDADGAVRFEVRGVRFRRVAPATLRRITSVPQDTTAETPPGPSLLDALSSAADDAQRRLVLGRHLAARLAAVLGAEPESVAMSEPLVDLADSLMLAELKVALERDLGRQLPIEVFFDDADLASLCDRLLSEMAAGATHAGAGTPMQVDELAREADAARAVVPRGAPAATGPTGPHEVLLTGATGFVGAYVLAELLRRTDAVVHCLVRGEDGRERLRANLAAYGLAAAPSDRIEVLAGDFTRADLGVEEADRLALSDRLEAIYHCGAVVNWLYPYRALKEANVEGTLAMLRLATAGRPIPFHFVSTVGVFSSPAAPRSVGEDDALSTSGPLSVGYAQSKWVAEEMVRRAGAAGLPVTIHRPSVGSDSTSGAFNARDHNWLTLRACIALGAAPAAPVPLQLAPVDYVARAIVALSLRPELSGRTFHLVNPVRASWRDLFDAARDYGYHLDEQPIDRWLARLAAADVGAAAGGLVPFFTDSIGEVSLPYFDASATAAALAKEGIVCPPLDRALLVRYLDRLVESGFLDPPKARRPLVGSAR